LGKEQNSKPAMWATAQFKTPRICVKSGN